MRTLGLTAHAFDAHYKQDELDEEWLPKIAKEGWVVVTKDLAIRKNFAEINLIQTLRIGMFLLPNELKTEGYLDLVTRTHKRLLHCAQARSGPFIYKVDRSGKLERRDTEEFLAIWRKNRAALGLPPLHH